MNIYLALFAIPTLFTLLGHWVPKREESYLFRCTIFMLLIIVGLRREVGGDWGPYEAIVRRAYGVPLETGLKITEPAYALVNWLGANTFGGIYSVNTVCALLSVIPLGLFCRSRLNPWLSLVVATPYLVVVVYMGYTRQSAAIGLCLLSIMALERSRFWTATAFVMLAGLFHTAAVGFFVPTLVLSGLPLTKKNVQRSIMLATVGAIYLLMVAGERLPFLSHSYIPQAMGEAVGAVAFWSAGAVPRLGLGVLAGAIYVWLVRQRGASKSCDGIWMLSAVGCFVLLPLALVTSTFADRVGLYLIPLQLHVASLVDGELESFAAQQAFRVAVVGMYGALLAVWLSRSRYAEYWLPYDNLLFHLL